MSDDLNKKPLELTVVPNAEIPKSKFDSEDTVKKLYKLFTDGPVWRSLSNLATKLEVDAKELEIFLDKSVAVCQKPGKEDGVRYYALIERLKKDETPEEKKIPKQQRQLITEEDRYASASLHLVYGDLVRVLDKYAIRVFENNKEAFTFLMKAKENLSAGIVLYHNSTKTELEKLPKI